MQPLIVTLLHSVRNCQNYAPTLLYILLSLFDNIYTSVL